MPFPPWMTHVLLQRGPQPHTSSLSVWGPTRDFSKGINLQLACPPFSGIHCRVSPVFSSDALALFHNPPGHIHGSVQTISITMHLWLAAGLAPIKERGPVTVPNAQFQDITLQHLSSKDAICDSKIQHAQARHLTQNFELAHLQSGRTSVCRFALGVRQIGTTLIV